MNTDQGSYIRRRYPAAPCMGCLTLVLETWSVRRANATVALVALFLVHALGLGGKLLLAALLGISMRPQAGRIEGENSGAVRTDDHDGHWAQHSASAEETEAAVEGDEFVFGWGADYTHYFIGFVLLYVCGGCCAGWCGLCVIWEISTLICACVCRCVPACLDVFACPPLRRVSLSLCFSALWLKVDFSRSRYARYKTLASSGTSTVVGTPPASAASTPRQQLPAHETQSGVSARAQP